ncbi:uncharacterized protein LOC134451813 [Engraulis encrasicolus]|uniref:uncharacterized protein LOC134451813 n=1 Tax=Engraulis encrasicolus TaxID=184585 RepID=UPI002FD710A7
MAIRPHVDYNVRLDAIEGLASSGKPAKQAIGFFLSETAMTSSTIVQRLGEAIQLLEGIGLEVKCVVCDQGSTNVRAMKDLGASLMLREDGSLSHCLSLGRCIPLIFDVPHLIKSVRNNLKKHPIQVEGQEVTWRHIEDFFLEDRKSPIRMAPKLTEKHISLPPFSNMTVKLATQVFSHSVAAGMKTMVINGTLQEEALHTANFVEKLDRLFDVLNSRSIKDQKYWRRPLTGNSSRMDYLQTCLGWLKTWKFGSSRTPPCHAGLIASIQSVSKIHQELQSEGVTVLCTSKLNQDCLEAEHSSFLLRSDLRCSSCRV